MVNAKYCSITVMLFSTCHLDGVQCGRISLYTYVVENHSELLHMAEPGAESTSKYVPAMENVVFNFFSIYTHASMQMKCRTIISATLSMWNCLCSFCYIYTESVST